MIRTDWSQLATILGFSKDIDVINFENPRFFDKAVKILTKWQEKLDKGASFENLIQALQLLERQDIIAKIKDKKKELD